MKNYILLFIFIVVFSCKKDQKNTTDLQEEKPNSSVVKTHKSPVRIKKEFNEELENWESYRILNTFMGRFKKASPNEVLSNALELEDLIKKMRDTLKPRILNNPSFNARVNIMLNESLRLSDMTTIPAITAEQVNEQTDKLLDAFSSVNAKINAILMKKKFEDAIDVNVDYIGLDSTKIDTVSRNSIRKTRPQKQLKIKNEKLR